MPLFECSKCHTVENTACSGFWWTVMHEKEPALCSVCDPEIGEWHNLFPRTTLEEYNRLHPDAKPVEYTIANQYGEDRTNG